MDDFNFILRRFESRIREIKTRDWEEFMRECHAILEEMRIPWHPDSLEMVPGISKAVERAYLNRPVMFS